ncbi:MAG: ABC transporter substrate-binding protein [Rhodothermales bacterium]
MLNRLTPVLLALLAFAFAAAPASAQSGEIQQMLRQRDAEIKSILGPSGTPTAAQREKLRDVVNGVIDFEAMAKGALGPFWSDLSVAQRTAFVDVFGGVVRAQSLADLDLYRARVTYGDVDVNGATALARTTARSGDVNAAVDYALAKKGNAWYVTDIVIDGTGTVEGYATSFQRVMKRQGAEAGYEKLMTSLRKRLARS